MYTYFPIFIPIMGPVSSVSTISLVVLRLCNWIRKRKNIFFACVPYAVFVCVQLTVDPHHLILYLQICLLTETCNPQINTCTFVVLCGHMQSCEKFESSDMHVPCWGGTRWSLCSCFSSYTINKCLFDGLFSATFFSLFAFWWWFHFKMSHKCSAEGGVWCF